MYDEYPQYIHHADLFSATLFQSLLLNKLSWIKIMNHENLKSKPSSYLCVETIK